MICRTIQTLTRVFHKWFEIRCGKMEIIPELTLKKEKKGGGGKKRRGKGEEL